VKACVLALTLLQNHRILLERTNYKGQNQMRQTAFKLGATLREDDRDVLTPFGHIFTAISAIVAIIRTHIENSMVITVAMRVLAELRATALLSVPAGMQVRGGPAVKAFQALLIEAGGKDVEWLMQQAARRLVKAEQVSQAGDRRIAEMAMKPSDLRGNGEWLTPRLRQDADKARTVAIGLAGDALRGTWENAGEPGRWEKIHARRQEHAEEAKLREELSNANEMGMNLEEYREHVATLNRESLNEASSQGSDSQGEEDVAENDPNVVNWEEEQLYGEQEWVRAIGFGVPDVEDFDRVWRKPITEAIARCLPQKAPPDSLWAQKAEEQKKKLMQGAAALGVPLDDTIDELLVVEMLESVQGKLRIKATIRPQDKIQDNLVEMRGNMLAQPVNTSKLVTCELAKNLTKNGFLLPKYGLNVKLNKRSASAPSLAAMKKQLQVDVGLLPAIA